MTEQELRKMIAAGENTRQEFKSWVKCGNYKQFTLTRLLDTSIESDAVSPTQIFGLDREIMEKITEPLLDVQKAIRRL